MYVHIKPIIVASLQFHESWTKLMEWLEESERALDSELEIANEPDKIKLQLAQHKVTASHPAIFPLNANNDSLPNIVLICGAFVLFFIHFH